MIKCNNCGTLMGDDASVCPVCGSKKGLVIASGSMAGEPVSARVKRKFYYISYVSFCMGILSRLTIERLPDLLASYVDGPSAYSRISSDDKIGQAWNSYKEAVELVKTNALGVAAIVGLVAFICGLIGLTSQKRINKNGLTYLLSIVGLILGILTIFRFANVVSTIVSGL